MAKFKQGESGNPEGRPKGSVSITSAIRRKLESTNPATKRLYVDDLVDVMIERAVKEKDFRVIKEIWNHIDGSPRQTTELYGDSKLITGVDIFVRDSEYKPSVTVSPQSIERYNLLKNG